MLHCLFFSQLTLVIMDTHSHRKCLLSLCADFITLAWWHNILIFYQDVCRLSHTIWHRQLLQHKQISDGNRTTKLYAMKRKKSFYSWKVMKIALNHPVERVNMLCSKSPGIEVGYESALQVHIMTVTHKDKSSLNKLCKRSYII